MTTLQVTKTTNPNDPFSGKLIRTQTPLSKNNSLFSPFSWKNETSQIIIKTAMHDDMNKF